MYSVFNKFIKEDISNIIIGIFILILPLIMNIHIEDMILSIRYLSLGIVMFLLYLLNLKNGINTDVFKNPIIISLILLFCINLFSAQYHNFTADAIFSLSRLFVLLSLTIFFANFFIKENLLFMLSGMINF